MALVDLVMPKMGESIMEATVLKWHKQPGDHVNMDETILEIATDKVDSEVPSTAEGVIKEILFKVDDVVPVGTVIARIETGGAAAVQPASAPAQAAPEPPTPAPTPAPQPIAAAPQPTPAAPVGTTGGNRFYSPLVLNIAAKEGIGMAELENIPGTGAEGRVSKKDILAYVANRKNGAPAAAPAPAAQPAAAAPVQAAPQPEAAPAAPQPEVNYGNNVEIIEMDRMRKMIADHMVRSKATSAHVTSFTEADVTNIVKWRDRVKGEFQKKYNEKITFTPITWEKGKPRD